MSNIEDNLSNEKIYEQIRLNNNKISLYESQGAKFGGERAIDREFTELGLDTCELYLKLDFSEILSELGKIKSNYKEN